MYGTWKRRVVLTVAGVAAVGVTATAVVRNMRRNPSASSSRSGGFEVPRPFLTREELCGILNPKSGEDILEVGPGRGYYSLDVARKLSPGTLHVLDVQRGMLDPTCKKAKSEGITNIIPALSDAAKLPYPDDSMDAAFVVAVLGEVPDKRGAVRELRRVVKAGGRVVFGEAITDPHRVSSEHLRRIAEDSGFSFAKQGGNLLGTFHLFSG